MRHSMQPRTRIYAGIAVLGLSTLGSFLALSGNLPLRFTYPPLNYLAFIVLALAIPIALAYVSFNVRYAWARWLVGCLSVLALIPTGILSFFAFLSIIDTAVRGKDASFEPVAELRSGTAIYRAYRTNGGATTDFGIVLRKENILFPGIRYVRSIYSRYHAKDASLTCSSDRAARLTVEAYGPNSAETFDFEL
jgi:hypothetical protein